MNYTIEVFPVSDDSHLIQLLEGKRVDRVIVGDEDRGIKIFCRDAESAKQLAEALSIALSNGTPCEIDYCHERTGERRTWRGKENQ